MANGRETGPSATTGHWTTPAGGVRRGERPPLPARDEHVAQDVRAVGDDPVDAGVDGIITDRPDVLRDVLVARGQWRPLAPPYAPCRRSPVASGR